jgi:hypothetical protein
MDVPLEANNDWRTGSSVSKICRYLAEGYNLSNTGRPRLTIVRPTNIRTYEQTSDVHSAGPANSCSRYEHGHRHVVAQVSSTEQATYERKFGTQTVRKLGTPLYYRKAHKMS